MLSLCLAMLLAYPAADLVIKDGDRIVMVGGALIEREQQYGSVELMLQTTFHDKRFTVRNLGWSGDTVWGEARAEFGSQADGYKKLVEQVKACKPTVLILGYGTNEAFAGKEGEAQFSKQYRQFLSDVASAETRCLFLTIPTPKLAKVSPKFAQAEYDGAIKNLAKERNGMVVNLRNLFHSYNFLHSKNPELTDDGILPNELGYEKLALSIAYDAAKRRNDLLTDSFPDSQIARKKRLRQLILKKNELFFHQYRPQNDTYLFLFRKHEQGNNAVEIPKFGPLIEELDAKINELKKQK